MDIKKIYISGGSQCIGGGFNWPEVKKVYKEVFNLEIENHLDVAYPTIVGKHFNVPVVNEGDFGGSVHRLLRLTYDYIFKNINDLNDTLFIIEIPPGWREEVYSNELKRMVNMTIGNILSPDDPTDFAGGHDKKDLHKIHKVISSYFEAFVDYDLELDKWMRGILGLLSYFKLNNLKYILIDTGDFQHFLFRNKVKGDYNYIWFEGPNWPYNTTPMTHWLNEQKLLIKDETNGLATDEHMGIEAHKIVANHIINYVNEKL